MTEKNKKSLDEIDQKKKEVIDSVLIHGDSNSVSLQGNLPKTTLTNIDFLRLAETENKTLWEFFVSAGVYAIQSGFTENFFDIIENTLKTEPEGGEGTTTIANLLSEIFVSVSPAKRERIINQLNKWERQKDQNLSLWGTHAKNEITNLVLNNSAEEHSLEKIIFTLDGELTSKMLLEVLSPFLVAVNNLQKIISDLKGIPEREIVIKQITQFSPVSVSLEGASDAIEVIKNTIVPWRREHVQKMSWLSEQEKMVEIERTRAEVLEIRAKAQREKAEKEKLEAESKAQLVQVEKSLLEVKKEKLVIQQSKIQLALNVVQELAPNLSETEKIRYLAEFLQVLNNLTDSPVELK